MAYSALTHCVPGWVGKLREALLTGVLEEKSLSSPEVGPDAPEFPPISAERYEGDLKAARNPGAGVVLYHLALLQARFGRRAVKGMSGCFERGGLSEGCHARKKQKGGE